jgi:hypothetical protein
MRLPTFNAFMCAGSQPTVQSHAARGHPPKPEDTHPNNPSMAELSANSPDTRRYYAAQCGATERRPPTNSITASKVITLNPEVLGYGVDAGWGMARGDMAH